MLINVFTPEECQEILHLSDGCFDKDNIKQHGTLQVYYDKVKSHVMSYLASNDITLSESAYTKFMIHTSSTEGAKKWHYDDVTILNFIINIQGEGTKVLIDGKTEVLAQGFGCMAVGEQGYTNCSLKPILHCGPPVDVNRCVMKFLIIPSYHVTKYITGPSVCEYGTEEYKKRAIELETMLENDLKIIKAN